MARPYRFYGILLAGGVLVPLSYTDFLVYSLHQDSAGNSYVAGCALGLIGVAAALGAAFLQRRRAATEPRNATSIATILDRQWLPLGLLLLLTALCFWSGWFSQYHLQHAYGYNGGSSDSAEKWSPHVLAAVCRRQRGDDRASPVADTAGIARGPHLAVCRGRALFSSLDVAPLYRPVCRRGRNVGRGTHVLALWRWPLERRSLLGAFENNRSPLPLAEGPGVRVVAKPGKREMLR